MGGKSHPKNSYGGTVIISGGCYCLVGALWGSTFPFSMPTVDGERQQRDLGLNIEKRGPVCHDGVTERGVETLEVLEGREGLS